MPHSCLLRILHPQSETRPVGSTCSELGFFRPPKLRFNLETVRLPRNHIHRHQPSPPDWSFPPDSSRSMIQSSSVGPGLIVLCSLLLRWRSQRPSVSCPSECGGFLLLLRGVQC
ncbi:hypothetical protein BJX96DRAFT_5059 [Aspergillus floccosus]